MTPKQLTSIQAMRGIASLLVVLYHLGVFSQGVFGKSYLNSVFKFGYSGVDVFFVLSGFIIFYVNYDNLGNKSRVKKYLIQRLTRIFPIYWFINLLVIPLFFAFPHYGEGYERNFSSIVTSLLLIPHQHAPIISVAWTLTQEIKFYLLFSLLIFLGIRKALVVFVPIFSISLINFVLRLKGISLFTNPIIDSLFSYLNIEFALGCLSAYLLTKRRFFKPKPILILSTILFLAGAYLYENHLIYLKDAGRVVFYGLPSFGIILSLTSLDIASKLKFKSIFLTLGDASYSLYLIHQVTIAIIMRSLLTIGLANKDNSSFLLTLSAIIVCTLGVLIYKYVERPLINFSRKTLVSRIRL